MDTKNKLEESKLRLKGAFESLEGKIKKLKNKSLSDVDEELLNENNELKSELLQMEVTLMTVLNRIKNKIIKNKKPEMVE